MATPTVTPFSTPPSTSDPANFNTRADTFLGQFPTFVTEINALVPFLTLAAGRSAISAVYTFSTATSGDPGAGAFRLNNATQTSATGAGLDLLDSNGDDVSGVLAKIGAGTSDVKGDILVTLAGDPTVYLHAEVTSATSPTGYRSAVLQNVTGSSANPFSNGDEVLVTYVRSGDKGDTGSTAPAGVIALIEEQKANNVAPSTPKVSAAENKRDLNTVVYDGIGVSLSSGQVTLPAGTYLIAASAPCSGVNNNKTRLRNVTDNTTAGVGTSERAADLGSSYFIPARSWLWTRFTIASSKAFELLHFISGSSASGADLGSMGDTAGASQVEVYATMFIWKLA